MYLEKANVTVKIDDEALQDACGAYLHEKMNEAVEHFITEEVDLEVWRVAEHGMTDKLNEIFIKKAEELDMSSMAMECVRSWTDSYIKNEISKRIERAFIDNSALVENKLKHFDRVISRLADENNRLSAKVSGLID